MGTTLENGVYLPSEGERNCYAGLKTNWEILDQKVADVTALQQAVAGALHRQIVASLPTTDIDPNTIYMILSGTSATENVYNEFMYVNNAWELIGTSATDLTNYYTKAEVDGKLLLKANASDLTSHTGDTTIHVTASDKTKWTNSANTVVLRLAKTALTPSSSTNAFSNLDDSTALKVGDKVMDTAGVLFSITAIDTQNSTFTIGTALIDLASDSDVVHNTGNETVGGKKTFIDELTASKNATNGAFNLQNFSYDPKKNGQSAIDSTKSFSINALTSTSDLFGAVSFYGASDRTIIRFTARYYIDSQNFNYDSFEYILYGDGTICLRPRNNNNTTLGESNRKWKNLYSNQINSLTPSSLSLPDFNNSIDISGYVTNLSGYPNDYIAPANGFISISATGTGLNMLIIGADLGVSLNRATSGSIKHHIPILKDQTVRILVIASSLEYVKFIPCQGNL